MSFWSRLVNVVRPGRLDDDIAAEIEDHIARRTASLQAEGVAPDVARRQAVQTFGNVGSIRDQGRDIRTWLTLDSIVNDIGYAVRGLKRSPAFTVTALSSLGLTIGAATALYGVLDAALFRPLPVSHVDRLFTLTVLEPPRDNPAVPAERTTFSIPAFRDFRDAAGSAASLALLSRPNRVELQMTSEPSATSTLAAVQFVSEDAFAMLKVPAAIGTTVVAAGDRSAAILSWRLWRQRFGGDPAIVDRMIRIDGQIARVAGVAARGFSGVEPGTFVDIWRPIASFDSGALTNRSFPWGNIVGRLGDGVTLAALATRLTPAHLDDWNVRAGHSAGGPSAGSLIVRPASTGLSDTRAGMVRPVGILLVIAAITALIASANVGCLVLARMSSRSIEMAVRTSLGAGPTRLLRQLATENLVLAIVAGMFGWMVAAWATPTLASLLSAGPQPLQLAIDVDGRALCACATATAACAVFLALLPACSAVSARPWGRMRGATAFANRGGISRALIATQIAFACCLVANGVAFVITVRTLLTVEKGFDAHGVTVLRVGADRMLPLSQVQDFQRRLAAHPEIGNATVAWWPIFEGSRRMDRVVVAGAAAAEREEIFYRVSPEYFATLATPLLAGRDFTFTDGESGPQVPTIVNRAFARRYFGTDAAVGREFQRADGTGHRVIGVAADSYYGSLRSGPDAIVYFPMKPPRWFTVYVRSAADAVAIAELARPDVASLGANAHIIESIPLDRLVENTVQRERLLAVTGGAFAVLALMIAAIGVFGFLNYHVSSRRRDIGIRSALGASRGALMTLVLGSALGPVASGLVVGMAAAVGTVRLARSLLFGVGLLDPTVLAGTMGIFVFAATVAALLPVRRAAAVDPIEVLRS